MRRSRPPASRARSNAYRALQAMNSHPHRLGTAGYAGKEEQWKEEDEAATASNTPPVFGDIPHPRARNWVRARYQKNEDGIVSLPNPQDQQVYDNIKELVAEQQASQEACSQRREDDVLTKALGTKEHRGRTRGGLRVAVQEVDCHEGAERCTPCRPDPGAGQSRAELLIRREARVDKGPYQARDLRRATEPGGCRCCYATRFSKSHAKAQQLRIN